MANKKFWINIWYVLFLWFLCFASTSVAEDHEHIHIKLHLPEVIKKHTHLRTVMKHHFHPKKHHHKLHHHHHNHYIDEGLSTNLNPSIAFPPPFLPPPSSPIKPTFVGGHFTGFGPSSLPSLPTSSSLSWKPKTKVVDVKFRKPLSSLTNILPPPTPLSTNNWNWENDFPKLLKTSNKYPRQKFNDFANHLPNYEFSANNIKFHQNFNKFEDDDEDEFLMTEDTTSLEHPNALRFNNNPFNAYNTLPNNFDEHWMAAAAAAASSDSIDSASSFESTNTDIGISGGNNGLWSNPSSLLSAHPPIDQTAYAATIQNQYDIDEGRHSEINNFERFPSTTMMKSKFPFDPDIDNYMEYNYNNRRPQKHWKKMKRNKPKLQAGNPSSFRIQL